MWLRGASLASRSCHNCDICVGVVLLKGSKIYILGVHPFDVNFVWSSLHTKHKRGGKKIEKSKQRNLRHRPITGVFLQLMTPINKSVVGMNGWTWAIVRICFFWKPNPTSYVRMGSGSRPVWGRYLFFLIIVGSGFQKKEILRIARVWLFSIFKNHLDLGFKKFQ
jgi:hypothetical protein